MNGFNKLNSSLAVTAIIVSVLALSFGDAVIKAAGLSLPLWQMYILRSGLALPILVVILVKRRPLTFGSVLWISVRSILLVVMWLCYYVALPQMPLSVAAAAYYTSPIFIVILAAMLSRQAPAPRIWFAIILGFCGVVLIVRPDTSGFQPVTLLPVLGAVIYAIAAVLTSVKCRDEDTFVLVTVLNIAFIVCGLFLGTLSGEEDSFLLGSRVDLDLETMGVITVLAGAMVIGSVGAAYAYQNAPTATIATFDYTYLVFSLVWGILFFSEFPNGLSLCGIIIIVIAGLLALPKNDKVS